MAIPEDTPMEPVQEPAQEPRRARNGHLINRPGSADDAMWALLAFLREHAGDAIPPNVREMAAAIDRSPGTAQYTLGKLEARGLITRRARTARSVRLTRRAFSLDG